MGGRKHDTAGPIILLSPFPPFSPSPPPLPFSPSATRLRTLGACPIGACGDSLHISGPSPLPQATGAEPSPILRLAEMMLARRIAEPDFAAISGRLHFPPPLLPALLPFSRCPSFTFFATPSW